MDIKQKYREEFDKEPYCQTKTGTYVKIGTYSNEYVKWLEKQLSIFRVSQCNEQLMTMLTSRVLSIQSEPDGIVRETMINNLLIDINCT